MHSEVQTNPIAIAIISKQYDIEKRNTGNVNAPNVRCLRDACMLKPVDPKIRECAEGKF